MDHKIIGNEHAHNWVSAGLKNASLLIVFRQSQMSLTSYSFKSRTDKKINIPKEWVIEGSNDNKNWELIHSHPPNNDILGRGKLMNWETTNNNFFHYFKITQTGENGNTYENEGVYFTLNKIEFFGQLLFQTLTCKMCNSNQVLYIYFFISLIKT